MFSIKICLNLEWFKFEFIKSATNIKNETLKLSEFHENLCFGNVDYFKKICKFLIKIEIILKLIIIL